MTVLEQKNSAQMPSPTIAVSFPTVSYKYSFTGTPELVATCEAGKVCHTVGDGSVYQTKGCKCTTNDDTCGETFLDECKLKVTAIYTCKKGEDPVFKKDCYPDDAWSLRQNYKSLLCSMR